MTTRRLHCPKCRTMQTFRLLDKEERAAVREEQGPDFYLDNLWRCTGTGCRTYYPQFHKAGYGLLPERFGEEAAARD